MTAVNFSACLDFTLHYEGGFVNNPKDPGGATNLGVTRRVLSAWRRAPASSDDVRRLPRAEVLPIYTSLSWDHIGGDTLPDGVDLMLFDIAVNMGVGRADQFATQTTSMRGLARVVALDRLRVGFWRQLRIFNVFGVGWLRRETACLAEAKRMLMMI